MKNFLLFWAGATLISAVADLAFGLSFSLWYWLAFGLIAGTVQAIVLELTERRPR